MKFAKVRYSCLGCKATLAPGDTTLCKHCRNKVGLTECHLYGRSCCGLMLQHL